MIFMAGETEEDGWMGGLWRKEREGWSFDRADGGVLGGGEESEGGKDEGGGNHGGGLVESSGWFVAGLT
jgi:hypothetical protein